jgi:cell division protein FtsL
VQKISGKRRRREILRMVLAYVFLFATLIFYVWSRFYAVELAYHLNALTAREKDKTAEKRGLIIEATNLGSLQHIEAVAREDLGFQEVPPDHVVYLPMKKPGR